MSKMLNRVRINVSGPTGTGGPIVMGLPFSNAFATVTEAGGQDGDILTYILEEGNDFEINRGVFTSVGNSLGRNTPLLSKIGGTAGTTKMPLAGSAQVRVFAGAEDFHSGRGWRVITGSTDSITQKDGNGFIAYNRSSAVAVDIAQITGNAFPAGWFTHVKNINTGDVTITPVTSTINGAATYVLTAGNSAIIISDGTNYQVIGISKSVLDMSSTEKASVRAVLPNPGAIFGLIMSTAGSSTTLTVSAGYAADSTNVVLMRLASSLAKTTSAWAAGAGGGGLDTGTIANNTWYHWFLIYNPTSGAVDVLCSTGVTPTAMPAGYTMYRRIGSAKTNGSAQWTKFVQVGNEFLWDVPAAANISVLSISSLAYTLEGIPTGLSFLAKLSGYISVSSSIAIVTLASGLTASPVSNTPIGSATIITQTATIANAAGIFHIMTNSSAQIQAIANMADVTLTMAALGWTDTRGIFG